MITETQRLKDLFKLENLTRKIEQNKATSNEIVEAIRLQRAKNKK